MNKIEQILAEVNTVRSQYWELTKAEIEYLTEIHNLVIVTLNGKQYVVSDKLQDHINIIADKFTIIDKNNMIDPNNVVAYTPLC